MQLPKLFRAQVLKKYKMFFVDALLDDGSVITAYTKNKGGFSKEMGAGKFIYVSYHDDPNRKTKYSVELIEQAGVLTGVDPNLGVKLLSEYFELNQNVKIIKKEVSIEDSRLDLQIAVDDHLGYGEIKSVFTFDETGARFPESVTERGQKHLKLLTKLAKKKVPVMLFYIVQVPHVSCLNICKDVDPEYGRLMKAAIKAGVQVVAYRCKMSVEEIVIEKPIPVIV